MKKYILSITLSLAIALAANAQKSNEHALEIKAGIGTGSLHFNEPNTEAKSGFLYNIALDYTWYFNPMFGISSGVGFTQLTPSVTINGNYIESGLTDTQGDSYDRIHELTDWQEKYSITMLDIPLLFKGRFDLKNVEKVVITGYTGFKYRIPTHSTFEINNGTWDVSGYYEKWDVLMGPTTPGGAVPEQGFIRKTNYPPKDDFTLNNSLALIFGAGMQYKFNDLVYLTASISYDVGLTRTKNNRNNTTLIKNIDQKNDSYKGVTNISDLKTSAARIEMGICYKIGQN